MQPRTRHLGWSLAALAAAALLFAACGVANPFASKSPASTQDLQAQALKFTQCMRQHGVNLPDPGPNGTFVRAGSGGGSGVQGQDTNLTIDPQSPQFQAAQQACKQYQPNGGQTGGGPSQQQLDALTRYAQCMRDHGIPMQDPQRSGGGGVGISIQASPGTLSPDSDQFKQAQQACQRDLPAGGPGGRASTGGS